MTPHIDAKLAEELAGLFRDGQVIYQQYLGLPQTPVGLGGITSGLEGKVKQWIERAMKLAKDVKADNVSITAGFPLGLSVTVGFTLQSHR